MSSSYQCGRSTKNDTCLPWQISMATYFSLLFDDGVSMTVASYTLFGWITLKTVPACPERDLLPLSRAALTAWRGARIARGRVGCHHRSCCLCYLLHQTWSRLGSGCCPCAVRSLRSATRILGVTGRDKRHWSTDRLPILSLNVWVGSFWMLIGHCFLAHCLNNMKSCSEASQNYISWSKVFSHRTALDTQVPAMTQSMSCGRYKPFKLVAAGPARPQLVGTKKPGRLLLEVSRLPPSLKVGSSSLAHDTLTCILSHTWD